MTQTPDTKTPDSTAARFGHRYEQCAQSLYLWMHLQVGPSFRARISADDLVQETWCRAYQAFERFDANKGSFKSWLYGIGEKVLIEELRRLAKRPTPMAQLPTPVATSPSQLPAELTSISERVARSEFARQLLEIANGLPEDERQILLFRGVEDLAFEEVAARLGITTAAVRSRWRRIRERCRAQLHRLDITLASLR